MPAGTSRRFKLYLPGSLRSERFLFLVGSDASDSANASIAPRPNSENVMPSFSPAALIFASSLLLVTIVVRSFRGSIFRALTSLLATFGCSSCGSGFACDCPEVLIAQGGIPGAPRIGSGACGCTASLVCVGRITRSRGFSIWL